MSDPAEELHDARARLEALACPYRSLPLKVTIAVRVGSVAHQLVEHLNNARADLVAIGIANAEHAQLPSIGLIAERLLRKTPCPVLAVPAGRVESANAALAPTAPWPRNILVAMDFSEPARAALPQAWKLAQQSDGVLQILHVNDTLWNEGSECSPGPGDAIEDARRQLEEEIAGEQTRSHSPRPTYPLLASGEPAREILACADRIAADVIVMGTHGRSQVGRFLLGSVTQEVLEHTVRPVLVTRPGD
jgi:nucleotide-binding universal stress UspA family protein